LISRHSAARARNNVNELHGISPSPLEQLRSIYDIKDNITWIKAAHTIKTGFDFAYEHKFEPTVTDVWGVLPRFGPPRPQQIGDASRSAVPPFYRTRGKTPHTSVTVGSNLCS